MMSGIFHKLIYTLLIIAFISTIEILGQRISGANVCGSSRTRCCRGWRLSQSRRCTVPICNNCQDRGCACVAPDRCICQEAAHITKREVHMKGDYFKGRCTDMSKLCSHSCQDLPGYRYSCVCFKGFSLNSDQRTCDRSSTSINIDMQQHYEPSFHKLQLSRPEREEIKGFMLHERFFRDAFSDIINSLEYMQTLNSQDPTITNDYISNMVFSVLEGKLDFSRTQNYVLNTDWVHSLKALDSTSLPESIITLRKIIITTLLDLYSQDLNQDINLKEEKVNNNKQMNLPAAQLNNGKFKYFTKSGSPSSTTTSTKSISTLPPNIKQLHDKYKSTPDKVIDIKKYAFGPKKYKSNFVRRTKYPSRQKNDMRVHISREDKLFWKSAESITLKPNVLSFVKPNSMGFSSIQNSLYKEKNEKSIYSVTPKQKNQLWDKFAERKFEDGDIKFEYFPGHKRPKGSPRNVQYY